jgi:hypothetical protein
MILRLRSTLLALNFRSNVQTCANFESHLCTDDLGDSKQSLTGGALRLLLGLSQLKARSCEAEVAELAVTSTIYVEPLSTLGDTKWGWMSPMKMFVSLMSR